MTQKCKYQLLTDPASLISTASFSHSTLTCSHNGRHQDIPSVCSAASELPSPCQSGLPSPETFVVDSPPTATQETSLQQTLPPPPPPPPSGDWRAASVGSVPTGETSRVPATGGLRDVAWPLARCQPRQRQQPGAPLSHGSNGGSNGEHMVTDRDCP